MIDGMIRGCDKRVFHLEGIDSDRVCRGLDSRVCIERVCHLGCVIIIT